MVHGAHNFYRVAQWNKFLVLVIYWQVYARVSYVMKAIFRIFLLSVCYGIPTFFDSVYT